MSPARRGAEPPEAVRSGPFSASLLDWLSIRSSHGHNAGDIGILRYLPEGDAVFKLPSFQCCVCEWMTRHPACVVQVLSMARTGR